jgi:hypothetical protein
MNRANRKGRRGIIFADLLLVFVIIIMAVIIVSEIGSKMDSRYRPRCFSNQEEADKLMWDILMEKKREVVEISAGYIIRTPDGSMKMYLVFLPRPGSNVPERVVVDLASRRYTGKGLCPLHKKPPADQPVIDYWYGAGRWRCLYNPYH